MGRVRYEPAPSAAASHPRMEESTPRSDPEALLAQRPWVKRVARALVRDGSRAEDLEQAVWLRALEKPRAVRSPRAWLGTALRNAASDLFRGDGRRRRREEAAAKPEAAPAVDEAVARAEALRRAVDAALALREPYRTAVVLRFFEDLSPPEIAKRLQVPLETVRTRLRRALEQLRDALDADHGGDRRAWMALLLPLAGRGPFPGLPGAPAAPAQPGAWSGADAACRAADAAWREGLAMTAKAAFAAGLGTAFAVGAGWWLLQGMEPSPDPAPVPPAPVSPFPAAAGAPPAGAPVYPWGRPLVHLQGPDVGVKGTAPSPLTVRTPVVVEGRNRVIYPVPAPPTGVGYVGTGSAETDATLLTLQTRVAEVREALGRVEALNAPPTAEAPAGAPCIEGVVVDEEGRPVSGGMIRLLPSGGVVEGGPGVTKVAVRGAAGAFRSPPLDAGHCYDVAAVYFPGYLGTRAQAVEPDGRRVTLVLARGGSIAGRVLEEDGTPVRGRVVVSARAEPAPERDASYLGGDASASPVRPDGTFLLQGLGDHAFRLRVTGEDYLDGDGLPPIRPGERVEVRVQRGAALLGRVAGWTAADAGRFVLFAIQDGKASRFVTVSSGGIFEARALRPGAVRLELAPAANPGTRFPLGTFAAPASDVEVRIPEEAR